MITMREFTCGQLSELQERNPNEVFLLDVREEYEVNICKIPHSIHIPMEKIAMNLDRLPKNKCIVIYCHHGIRSFHVANYLCDMGFKYRLIHVLKGGIDDWSLCVDSKIRRY